MVTGGVIPVVVVHWRRPDWCLDAVRSIEASTVLTQILVVDNGGADSGRLLESLPASVVVISPPQNLGYAGGANLGLAWAASTGAPLAVVCAHDCRVEPDTIELLTRRFAEDPRLGIAAPLLTDRVELPPQLDTTLSPEDAATAVPMGWVSGTMMMLRMDAIREIGAFDAVFGSYFEDVDLCRRARRSGWNVVVDPAARARGRGTGDPAQRDASVMNAVRLARLEHGWTGALRSTLGLLGQLARWTIGAIHPRRTRAQRDASRHRLRAAGRGLRRWHVVFGRPATDLPDRWPDPVPGRADA
jgi:glycosyltransferase involved in cell wall biosynthesis